MWKIQNFSITQILREMNFRDSRSAKTANLTFLKTLHFDTFLHFYRGEFEKNPTLEHLKTAKMAFFETLKWPNMISCKI